MLWGSCMKKGTESTGLRNDLEEYKNRVRLKKRKRYITAALTVLLVLILALAVKIMIDRRSYDGYRVLDVNEQLDSGVLNYKELGNYVFRYSGDGVSLIDSTDKVIWNDSIQMTSPVVSGFDETVAVYETKGTEIQVYNLEGKMGTIQTERPVLKACVSSLGGVAAILDNGENTVIDYYTPEGDLVASCSGNMRNPGYPMDLTLSADGLSMAVVYLVADGSELSSYLAFYNFGEAGKNKEDNLLDGIRFDGVIVPKVEYLNNKTLLVYTEDGFYLYKTTTLLDEVKKVTFEKEIVSSFGEGELFGFVFAVDASRGFEMKVYDASGKVQTESSFDLSYDKIKVSGDEIILHGSDRFAIIASNGTVRYNGNFEDGSILDIVKRGLNKYSVACSKGIVDIELK